MKEKEYKKTVSRLHTFISILIIALVAVAIIFLGRTAYRFSYAVFNETAMTEDEGREAEVTLTKAMSGLEIGKVLKEAGLVADPYVFAAQEYLSAYHGDEIAGTYTLNTSQTPTQMLAVMSGDGET